MSATESTLTSLYSDARPGPGAGLGRFHWSHAIIYVALIVSVLVLLAPYDGPVAEYFKSSEISHRVDTGWLKAFLRAPGEYGLAFLTAAVLLFLHPQTWRAAGMMLLSGVAGILNGFIKWIAGRARPFTWSDRPWHLDYFHAGLYGFFNQKNLSFTSGHTTQAFAWAELLAIAVPVLRWPAYAWAAATAFQRVASTDHYLTDAVAGAWLGVVTVRVTFRILSAVVPAARQEAASASPSRTGRAELANMSEFSSSPAAAIPAPVPATAPATTSALTPAAASNADRPYLSLVIPCYNEEESVPTLLKRVGDSMAMLGRPFEVIIVDDGSTDTTPAMLAEAKHTLPWLRIVRMAKNSGQSAGFEAGFTAARGQYIATIDADLQNDPEEVPRLAKMLDENPSVDMITGWRKDRQDTNFRRWQSRQANKIRNWISQDNINDSACSLKVYRDYTLKGLKLFNGAHRFFPALVKMRGYTVMETPVKHSQRFAGTAKYGFSNRAFRAFVDLLGVRWMKMRYLRYSAAESSASGSDNLANARGTPQE